MSRRAPKDVPIEAWSAFETWADNNGVGTQKADWLPWWACWADGWNHGVDKMAANWDVEGETPDAD